MPGESTFSNTLSLFKRVYADKMKDLNPKFAILQERLDFGTMTKLGDRYEQPVQLTGEHGFTYNGELGELVTLNDAVNAIVKSAEVRGSELILRGRLNYAAVSRAASEGEAAFKKSTAWKVMALNDAVRKRIEIAQLYGQSGVGTVAALAGQDITLTAASWAGGIWAGAENMVIDVYPASGNTVRQANLVITAVNSDTRTLTVSGTTTGIVATDVIWFKGVRTSGVAGFNEMVGLQKIFTTTTGNLFNIDTGAYSLWRANQYAVGGALTFSKMQEAIARAINRGLLDDLLLLVSPKTFAAMNSDQAALRSYDYSYKSSSSEQGFEALKFHGQNGLVEVVSHPFVKDGDAFAMPVDALQRIGSSDVTFGLPGIDLPEIERVPNTNAVEIQVYTDQAIFCSQPAHCIYFSGIS